LAASQGVTHARRANFKKWRVYACMAVTRALTALVFTSPYSPTYSFMV
jgi:hypothetical protein